MKKLAMVTAVVACASIVSAQTVTSQNIVGYTKVALTGGDLTLVSLNFDSSTTLSQAVGTAVPALSAAYKWDKSTDTYVTSTLNSRGVWSTDFTIDVGDAFFIAPSGTGSHEVILPGEVITTNVAITLPAGVRATGYYFPVSTAWESTQMSQDVPGLSAVSVWNEGTQGYNTYTKNTRGVWSGNPSIGPRDGFFVNNSGTQIVVDEPVPFTP